jgi:hypothetical protein
MQLQEFLDSDFFSFFNLQQTENTVEAGLSRIYFKPGGFQEHVDIEVAVLGNLKIYEAALELDRSFIGDEKNTNPFAKDICKSFIAVMCLHETDKAFDDIIDGIWSIEGTNDKILYRELPTPYEQRTAVAKKAIDAYRGLEPFFGCMGSTLVLNMYPFTEEGKERLRIFVDFLG